VEQEVLTHPESMSSIPGLSGVFGARSLVLCVVFCRYFFPLPFGHRITDVLLPLWYIRVITKLPEKLEDALTTILPILFQYCYKYCYSDSRNL
jgi:hypothetical protein